MREGRRDVGMRWTGKKSKEVQVGGALEKGKGLQL